MLFSDLSIIFSCWLLLFLWQFVGFVINYKLFANKTLDAGWGFGRLTTWLILSLIIWFLAHFQLPVNQSFFIIGLYFLLAFFSVKWALNNKEQLLTFFKKNKKIILTQELIFLYFFVFLSIVRGFNPRIEGLEKFMDVGFIAGYLRSPTLPAEDIWLAGFNINYYTFGHFMGSIATQFWSLSVDYSYNLLLALVMGLLTVQVFSLLINVSAGLLTNNLKILSKLDLSKFFPILLITGIIGTWLIAFSGNGHASWYAFSNRGFKDYWYPNATRFIENTIHEFPAYSFIVSDLHAHVLALPIVIYMIFIAYLWIVELRAVKQTKIVFSEIFHQPYFFATILMGILYGVSISTSTWDFLIYGLFLAILSLLSFIINKKTLPHIIVSAVIIGFVTLLVASPWFLNFVSISQGVQLVTQRSPLVQLLILWGPHLLVSFITAGIAFKVLATKKILKTETVFIIAMTGLALLLIIIPELVFVKDIYPTHPRANTMFKLTFQAFTLMTLVISLLPTIIFIAQDKQKLAPYKQLILKLVLTGFVSYVGYYAIFGYHNFYLGFQKYQSLDGLNWLKVEATDDYNAILWLRSNVKSRPVLLEAVGESYTTYARVSTFTGLPTVLGWRVHQWLWRGSFDIPGKRTEEVRLIYEQPLSSSAQKLIKDHQIEYIFIGTKEREAYPNLNETALQSFTQEVFRSNLTYILQVD